MATIQSSLGTVKMNIWIFTHTVWTAHFLPEASVSHDRP